MNGEKGSRTTTDLEVLGLPLLETWYIAPAPGWDAKDDVGSEGKDGDRRMGEHGYQVSTRKRRGSRECESERGTGSFEGAPGEKKKREESSAKGSGSGGRVEARAARQGMIVSTSINKWINK